MGINDYWLFLSGAYPPAIKHVQWESPYIMFLIRKSSNGVFYGIFHCHGWLPEGVGENAWRWHGNFGANKMRQIFQFLECNMYDPMHVYVYKLCVCYAFLEKAMVLFWGWVFKSIIMLKIGSHCHGCFHRKTYLCRYYLAFPDLKHCMIQMQLHCLTCILVFPLHQGWQSL